MFSPSRCSDRAKFFRVVRKRRVARKDFDNPRPVRPVNRLQRLADADEEELCRVSRGQSQLTPTAAAPIPSPPIIPSLGARRLASSAASTLARRVMPSYFACGGMGFLARASQDVSCPGCHFQMSDGVHEITVDGRLLER